MASICGTLGRNFGKSSIIFSAFDTNGYDSADIFKLGCITDRDCRDNGRTGSSSAGSYVGSSQGFSDRYFNVWKTPRAAGSYPMATAGLGEFVYHLKEHCGIFQLYIFQDNLKLSKSRGIFIKKHSKQYINV